MTPHEHSFLRFKSQPPSTRATELAVQLANYYAKASLSRNGWKVRARASCRWQLIDKNPNGDGSLVATEQTSKPFNAEDIRKHLIANRSFDHRAFNLPTPNSLWLDASLEVVPEFHLVDQSRSTVKLQVMAQLGPAFPLTPVLDREGTVYTSFQAILLRRIVDVRDWLVQHSSKPSDIVWFQNFRTVVCEAVALIENTLHQLYYKAKYDPLPGWTFDPQKLSKRHGARLADKLSWAYGITGRILNQRDPVAALMRIKEVRNHLQHFDPPVFACTLEEVAAWLNDIQDIACLAWKIRACADALPSVELIQLLLMRAVEFSPKDPEQSRVPRARDTGYASTSEKALQQEVRWQADEATVVLRYSRQETVL